MSRILHYNWVQCDDPQGRGGGVSVYLRQAIAHARTGSADTEFVLVSAGQHYGAFDRRLRWDEVPNAFDDARVKSLRILNSPIKAPAHDMFFAIRDWRTNRRIARLFARLMRAEGPFDTVVFHSMEGISSEVLALREQFPETRFVYMWHNYMPLCPQIELLHQARADCRDFMGGLKCLGCLGGQNDVRALIRAQRLGSSLDRAGLAGRPPGNAIFGLTMGVFQIGRALRFLALDIRQGLRTRFAGWRPVRPGRASFPEIDPEAPGKAPKGTDAAPMHRAAADYRLWRQVNRDILNRFDAHWAVSDLVAETIAGLGIDRDRITVTPLGHALHAAPEVMRARHAAKPERDRVVIGFLGYGTAAKGLPFITEALLQRPLPVLAETAELVIHARLNPVARARLAPLAERFARLSIVDGYTPADLPAIARSTDLVIVPSICRETYNLVAYEMACLGTPSLVSSTVGFKMFLTDKPDFVFRSGDGKDFVRKLAALVKSPARRTAYFDPPPALPDIAAHFQALSHPEPSDASQPDLLDPRQQHPHPRPVGRDGCDPGLQPDQVPGRQSRGRPGSGARGA